jgi:hypothetical protein
MLQIGAGQHQLHKDRAHTTSRVWGVGPLLLPRRGTCNRSNNNSQSVMAVSGIAAVSGALSERGRVAASR